MAKIFGKTTGLVVVSILVLLIAAPFGPLGQLPQTFLVDENYLKVVRNQDLFLGCISFFFVLLANIPIKLPIGFPVLAAVIGGTLFVIFAQSGDPEFLDYLGSEIVDFHSSYVPAGIAVTLVFVGVAWWFRNGKTGKNT